MTNYDYKQISVEDAKTMSVEHLTYIYNDAVSMIWHLNIRIEQLMVETEAVWAAYDDISNKYFG